MCTIHYLSSSERPTELHVWLSLFVSICNVQNKVNIYCQGNNILKKRTILMINYFILLYESIYIGLSNYFTCISSLALFKTWLYLSKNQIKLNIPHHAIIEFRTICQMCRRDSKSSTVTSYPLENRVYDITVLVLLSHPHIRHMARYLIITWWGFYAIYE